MKCHMRCARKNQRRHARWESTRPSVDYAKDWLDQSFLFPGLEKGFTYDMDVITGEQPAIIWPSFGLDYSPPPALRPGGKC